MPVRSLTRALAVGGAACALALVSAGLAAADPNPAVTSGNVTSGTDVAAPDQQNPIPAEPKPVPQEAPTWPENPQFLHRPVAATSADADFQWDDAGIGAGGAVVVVLAGLGAAVAIRRRRIADPPLPA